MSIEGKVASARLVDLATVTGPNGKLTVVEAERTVPFAVKRLYYFYDVPPGQQRGGLAHRAVELCMVAVAGSMEVTLDDGTARERFSLDRPDRALLVPPLTWLEVARFSPGAVGLTIASEVYDADDYVRDYDEFRRMTRP